MKSRHPHLLRWLAVGAAALPAMVVLLAVCFADDGDHTEAPEKHYYVHRIQLLDADRNPIDADSTVPYSPKQTCSSPECHSYEAIAKGMHFDMGKSLMADDWGAKHGNQPWHLSPGMAGGFLPTFRRQFARKKNESVDEIDMTAYEFVGACGPCHPGGGVMETDRDGQRYDARMKKEEGLADSLDGDYHKAKWDKSGVAEADCLMCHAQWQYNNDERTAQLGYQNYQFAPTAAAGFGLIAGKVSELKAVDEDLPPDMREADAGGDAAVTVQYDKRLFDAQGYVTLDIGRPKDHTCLFCHHVPALKDGEGFEHRHNTDVHTAQGMACVDCHSAGEDHNFELGRALHYSVGGHGAEAATTTHDPAMSCEGCHERGLLGAPLARHTGFPRFHFDKLACTACHTGPALAVKDKGTEPVISDLSASTPLTAGYEAVFPDQQAPWQITYHAKGGQLRVHNCQVPMWWGNRLDDDTVWPLFLREVAPAFEAAADKIKDDDGDGTPEVNTGPEIIAMDTALREALADGRFKKIAPAFVAGPHVLWVEDGEVKHAEHRQATLLCITTAHAVRGPQQAFGADGCTECHALDSYFFSGQRVLHPLNSQNQAKTRPMHLAMGYDRMRIRLGALREQVVKPVGLLLIPLTIIACLLHYLLFGPKRIHKDNADDEVARFSAFERVVHFLQMTGFVVLAVTGVGFLVAAQLRDAVPDIWTTPWMEAVHRGTGYIFIATSVLLIVRWLPTAMFRLYDLQWFKVMGGYLWMKGEAPAGKFNAGQKMLFWMLAGACIVLGATGLVMALRPESFEAWVGWAYFLHNLSAVLVIPSILGHIYLGTIANPGTLRAIFDGTVTRPWAAKHHPNWLEETGESSDQDV